MRTKLICPAVSISIRGVDFPLNLILLDSKGIDIIMGMDWLSKYDGVTQCTRKAVKLTKKDGTSVEFVAMVQSGPDSKLNHTKSNSPRRYPSGSRFSRCISGRIARYATRSRYRVSHRIIT
jgi:hypothetical protein